MMHTRGGHLGRQLVERHPHMRYRITFVFMVAALVLGGLLTSPSTQVTAAQTGTPAPDEPAEIVPGVTIDPAGMENTEDDPTNLRLHFAPGATFPLDPGGSLEVVIIEAGTLTVQLDGAIITGQLGTADAVGGSVPAGTTTSLTAGQYFVLSPALSGELRNDGDEIVTIVVTDIPAPIAATPAVATPED